MVIIMALQCMKCGRPLAQDEIGIYRRLVDRGARKYLCGDCLASYFRCPRGLIDEKIRYYKRIGCLLFSK